MTDRRKTATLVAEARGAIGVLERHLLAAWEDAEAANDPADGELTLCVYAQVVRSAMDHLIGELARQTKVGS